MYTTDFDNRINQAVASGKITQEARESLHEAGEELNIDDEELDIVIDGKMYLAKMGKLGTFDAASVPVYQPTPNEENDDDEDNVETTDDEGFNLGKFMTMLIHNRIVQVLFGVILLSILLSIFSGTTKSSSDAQESQAKNSEEAFMPEVIAIDREMPPTPSDAEETAPQQLSPDEEEAPRQLSLTEKIDSLRSAYRSYKEVGVSDYNGSYDGDHFYVCYKGKVVYVYRIEKNELMKYDIGVKILDAAMGHTGPNIIFDNIPEGEYSRYPSMGICSVVLDMEDEVQEYDIYANTIEFINNKKQIKVVRITGLEGESMADGLDTEEEVLDLF